MKPSNFITSPNLHLGRCILYNGVSVLLSSFCILYVLLMDKRYDIKLMEPSFSAWTPKPGAKSIAVMMSGGVDSSVTAHILKEAGWNVVGVTMKIPVACDTGARGCCGADAAFVCHELGMAHYFVDVTEAFNELIIERFRRSYAQGKTPNPCVDCNSLLKFSLVWDLLERDLGIEYVATGHYAKVSCVDGKYYLGRAKDKTKDQSYFIYGIEAERLSRFVLPLGEHGKDQVRVIAAELGLSVAEKAESMELCFAGEGDYRAALGEISAESEGELTDMAGTVIGTHKGISHYTLGQRRGIGYAGGEPLYVGRIDRKSNTVALGKRDDICHRTVEVDEINILIDEQLAEGEHLLGKLRSYGPPRPCKIISRSENNMTVEFDEAQFAPCPGQRLVLYNDSGNIVAGGTISTVVD